MFALANRREHAAIILCGGEHLVTRFQIKTEQQCLQRFRGVTCDCNFFAIAAKQLRQPGANRLGLRLENLPHRVGGRVFLLPDVTHQRFGDQARTGRHAAVVEIDYAARDGKGILNRRPIVFVHRRLFRRQMRDAPGCRLNGSEQRSDSSGRKRGQAQAFARE